MDITKYTHLHTNTHACHDVMFAGDNGDSLENPEKDNRNLVDGSGNQKLSRDDIEAMKKGGVGGHVRVVL